MTLLILGLYLADIVQGLNFVLGTTLFILVLLALIFIVLLLSGLQEDNLEYTKILKRYYKKYFFMLIFSVLAFCSMPSKNTVYIATGLVTSQKVIQHVYNSPLYEKSLKLLEKKIDAALSEKQDKEDKWWKLKSF